MAEMRGDVDHLAHRLGRFTVVVTEANARAIEEGRQLTESLGRLATGLDTALRFIETVHTQSEFTASAARAIQGLQQQFGNRLDNLFAMVKARRVCLRLLRHRLTRP